MQTTYYGNNSILWLIFVNHLSLWKKTIWYAYINGLSIMIWAVCINSNKRICSLWQRQSLPQTRDTSTWDHKEYDWMNLTIITPRPTVQVSPKEIICRGEASNTYVAVCTYWSWQLSMFTVTRRRLITTEGNGYQKYRKDNLRAGHSIQNRNT